LTRWLALAGIAPLAFTFALMLPGCSRHEAAPGPSGGAAHGAPTLEAPHASVPAPSSASDPRPVPVPEDAEDDAAQRITEQNLESELDRLEREIQAE